MPLISVSGTQGIGKSTFIKDFIANWPMFKTPEKTYRDVIKEKGLTINQETTQYSQGLILDSIIEIINSYSKNDNIIFDRCPLDNLVYSLWAYEKGKSDIDEDFVSECIQKARWCIQKLDIMFLIPMTSQNPDLVDDNLRDTDPVYQKEIDEIFQGLKRIRETGKDDVFFIKDDSPPIIEIFGDRQERIELSKLYLREDGSFYGEEDSLILDAQGDAITNNQEDLIDGGERDMLRKSLGLEEK